MKRIPVVTSLAVVILLIAGTIRDSNFWSTPTWRGDVLLRRKEYSAAAKAYDDPWSIGVARYRNGDFEEAAKTFARVPGAAGAFNRGNALLMHGAYAEAIESYDRALHFKPAWKEAEENRALAEARKAKLDAAGDKRTEPDTMRDNAPDKIVFDQKGNDKPSSPPDLSQQDLSEQELRATWLRQVQTTPGDFLRAKFAFQAAQSEKESK